MPSRWSAVANSRPNAALLERERRRSSVSRLALLDDAAWPRRPRAGRSPRCASASSRDARPCSSAGGNTASTSPMRSASAASIDVAGHAQLLGLARRRPGARSRCVPPKPGITPSLTSGWPNFALSRRVDEVARERELAAAAEREAVDRRDPRHAASVSIDVAERAARLGERLRLRRRHARPSRRCRRRRRTPCRPRRSGSRRARSASTSSSPATLRRARRCTSRRQRVERRRAVDRDDRDRRRRWRP